MNVDSAALLLDEEGIASDLLAVTPADTAFVRGPEMVSLWVKPGRYFNVYYRFVREDGSTFGVAAHVVDPERGKRIVAAAGKHTCTKSGEVPCGSCSTKLTRPDVLVQAFPLDYRLPGLPRCLDARILRAAAPNLEVETCEVKAYRPGMRCAIRYETGSGKGVFGKVSVESRGRGYAFRTQARVRDAILAADLPLRVPEPLAYVEELGLTVVSELRGTSLHDRITAGCAVDAEIGIAARALASFHALPLVVEERAFGADDELRLVEDWTTLASALFPELATALGEARRRLASDRPAEHAPAAALLHRDFHDKQVLFEDGEALAVLDLDTAAAGDRELDVANFCAHMWLRGLQSDRAGDALRWSEGFVSAYAHSLDRDRFDWYRRATLARLACNYALRPRWRYLAAELASAALEG